MWKLSVMWKILVSWGFAFESLVDVKADRIDMALAAFLVGVVFFVWAVYTAEKRV